MSPECSQYTISGKYKKAKLPISTQQKERHLLPENIAGSQPNALKIISQSFQLPSVKIHQY